MSIEKEAAPAKAVDREAVRAIAEQIVNKWVSSRGNAPELGDLVDDIQDAITAEREASAALRREVAELRSMIGTISHGMGKSTTDILDFMLLCAEQTIEHGNALERAEAAERREGELRKSVIGVHRRLREMAHKGPVLNEIQDMLTKALGDTP